ncbi:MAG TPA: hydroxyacylglutathione hydrolase [Magnetospirillaceae bacterium]|jgi:hydroxyacylglutathione hydrolase
MPVLEIEQIPVLDDNYVYLAREPMSGNVAVIDPAVSEAVLARLKAKNWKLTHILNTHHHGDHVGGNLDLKAATGCTIVGYAKDAARIPGIDVRVDDGDTYMFGQAPAKVIAVPGHTSGHIAYFFDESRALFCGDTIFALGCGRLFEGTPQQMWSSISKLRVLPEDTRVYCAHEYTQSNARFALTIETDNQALLTRAAEVNVMRAANKPTVPSTMGVERATNPFLRADAPGVARAVGLSVADPTSVFAEVRRRKDVF